MIKKFGSLTAVFGATIYFVSVAYADVETRYAELQMVPEAINDPDPLMRLAQLEAIMAEGDATKAQLALRTAFTVDDPNIRGLALRSHLSSFKTIVIEARMPEEVVQAINDGNNDRMHNNTAAIINGVAGQISISIEYNDVSQIEIPFVSLNYSARRNSDLSGSGNIRGTTITFAGPVRYGTQSGDVAMCSFEFYEYEGFSVRGQGSCDMNQGAYPFPVALRLF